jgi:hypothetical protein
MCIEKGFLFILAVLLFLFCLVDVLRAEEPDPLSLGRSIISNLQQLRQLNTELTNESQASKERSVKAEALMI